MRVQTTWSAHVAQLVEHVLGKDEVTGSIPVVSSRHFFAETEQIRRLAGSTSGGNSIGRVTAFQAVGCGFDSRLPLQSYFPRHGTSGDWADVAQLVERVLGKDEVTSSILVIGSIDPQRFSRIRSYLWREARRTKRF